MTCPKSTSAPSRHPHRHADLRQRGQLHRPGGQGATPHLPARAGRQGDRGQRAAPQAGTDRRWRGRQLTRWRRWPRACSSGSTDATQTRCSSPPSQPPPPTATCTRPAPTAAARRVAAGGAGRTRQSRSASWSRPGCWPPARWPSLGSSPAPAAADHEAKQQAELGEERWLLLDQLPTQVTTRGHQRPDRWAGPSGAWPPTPSARRPAGRTGLRPHTARVGIAARRRGL
jgi:hypothetical protein